MKIALIGYGKMGHAIERIALERGHRIVAIIDEHNQEDFDTEAFRSADVAIEFTTPKSAFDNYLKAFAQGVKVVSGSTGWTSRMDEIREICEKQDATFFWTSNFSIGVNIFFALNKYLAAMMSGFPNYRPEMTEIHHIHKLDHPSGTALMLADQIIDALPGLDGWSEAPDPGKLLINHVRHGEVPGIHRITWESPVDSISIEHSAKSRAGFALGAVMAAEWLAGRRGYHSIDEMMTELIK